RVKQGGQGRENVSLKRALWPPDNYQVSTFSGQDRGGGCIARGNLDKAAAAQDQEQFRLLRKRCLGKELANGRHGVTVDGHRDAGSQPVVDIAGSQVGDPVAKTINMAAAAG